MAPTLRTTALTGPGAGECACHTACCKVIICLLLTVLDWTRVGMALTGPGAGECACHTACCKVIICLLLTVLDWTRVGMWVRLLRYRVFAEELLWRRGVRPSFIRGRAGVE